MSERVSIPSTWTELALPVHHTIGLVLGQLSQMAEYCPAAKMRIEASEGMNMKGRPSRFLLIEAAIVELALAFHGAHAQGYGSGAAAIPSPSPDSGSMQTPQQDQQDQQPAQSSQPSKQQLQSESPPQPLGYGSPRPVNNPKSDDY